MDLFDKKGIKPMLISEQHEPYDDENSIFELKLDGIRCIAYCNEQHTDLRNKRDMRLLARFPELKYIHKYCKEKCILDGELIVINKGVPDFYEVQKRTVGRKKIVYIGLIKELKIGSSANSWIQMIVSYVVIFQGSIP